MKYNRFLLTLLIALCANSIFANSTCHLASTTDSRFKFNKRENIILALPKYPSLLEETFVSTIRQHLVEQKFKLVDSVLKADRILTFRIIENATMNFEISTHNYAIDESAIGEVRNNTTSNLDSGYTIIEMSMQDIGLLKKGERSTIWQSSISTKSENFDEYPELVLEKLVKLYGKNKVDDEKIKKPKNREKK